MARRWPAQAQAKGRARAVGGDVTAHCEVELWQYANALSDTLPAGTMRCRPDPTNGRAVSSPATA